MSLFIILSGDCSGPVNFQAKRNAAVASKFVSGTNNPTNTGFDTFFYYSNSQYPLAPYESNNVANGACVRTWTSPTNTGYYSFYGATRVSDVDICKTKDETTCAASNSGCTWVALQACTADTFTETSACDQQGHTDVPYPTNGKKTKFFVSGDADTCSRHTLTNPMCGDGRCDAVYTWNCVAPFCDPLVDYESYYSVSDMKWYSSKVSEKTTCPQDCKCSFFKLFLFFVFYFCTGILLARYSTSVV